MYVLPGVEATRWICLTMSEPFPESAATAGALRLQGGAQLQMGQLTTGQQHQSKGNAMAHRQSPDTRPAHL